MQSIYMWLFRALVLPILAYGSPVLVTVKNLAKFKELLCLKLLGARIVQIRGVIEKFVKKCY